MLTRPLLLFAFLAVALLVPSLAFAQDGGLPPGIGVWPAVALVGCMAASYCLRRFWPAGGFFHSPAGTLIASALSAILSAIQPVIAAHGLDGRAILMAALGALGALLAMSNPSVPLGSKAPMRSKPPLASIVALVMIPLGFGACLPPIAACKIPDPANVAKCKLENDLIACGATAGLNLVPIVLDIIVSAATGHFDAGALVATLEQQGFKDIPCVLAALQDYLLPIAPQLASHVHDALVFKLKKDGHVGTFTIKLKSGRSVLGTVPK